MNDPYGVLGISSAADDEEVKRAYRELARKYHPDNYQNNPLADLAEEKMKEINKAYDAILQARGMSGNGSAGRASGAYSTSSGDTTGGVSFVNVRMAINAGNLEYAEQLLNQIPARGAEWFFLSGSVAYRRGWMDEARQRYQTAYHMEPGNPEYRRAAEYMQSAGQAFYPAGFRQTDMSNAMDCCTALMCANCLCGGRGC